MQCPKCSSLNTVPASPTPSGSLRFRCRDCKKFWTLNPKKDGRPTIGDKPMTSYERLKRHIEKKKNQN